VVESQRWAQEAFDRLMERYRDDPPREAIVAFVADHFTMFDHMDQHVPWDWQPKPVKLMSLSCPVYRQFALDLNERWKLLRYFVNKLHFKISLTFKKLSISFKK